MKRFTVSARAQVKCPRLARALRERSPHARQPPVPPWEAAGIEPASRRKQNPKQVALLPANALISHRFVLPPHPVSSRLVPFNSPLEGHTGGTCDFDPPDWIRRDGLLGTERCGSHPGQNLSRGCAGSQVAEFSGVAHAALGGSSKRAQDWNQPLRPPSVAQPALQASIGR